MLEVVEELEKKRAKISQSRKTDQKPARGGARGHASPARGRACDFPESCFNSNSSLIAIFLGKK